MSILIKGMEMPKHGEGVCLIVTNFENCGSPVAMLVDRESILPKNFYDAIEIPTPHGRLIDCERATFPTAFRYNTNDYAKGWNACIKAVQTAPTIIEAEVSE